MSRRRAGPGGRQPSPLLLQGDEYPGLSACTFDTYEQRVATASGRKVYCIANPYFTGASDDPYAYQNAIGRFRRTTIQFHQVTIHSGPGDIIDALCANVS